MEQTQNSYTNSTGTIRNGSDMKILIVGGGLAGLTLCALLEQRGFSPTLVERASKFGNIGYVVIIWPSGSRILKGLGVYEQLEEASLIFTDYHICDHKGNTVNKYRIDPVMEKYGPVMGIYRPDLVRILRGKISENSMKMNASFVSLTDTGDGVTVDFTDGSSETYDLVVGCDGLRSPLRQQVFGDIPLRYSGISGWAFWSDPKLCDAQGITEYLGKGKFAKMWPTHGRLAVFLSIRTEAGVRDDVENRVETIRRHFAGFGGPVPEIMRSLDGYDPRTIHYGEYNDFHTSNWSRGRVVLLGDSAHAIMPIAGASLSMGMESASVLTEELCRTDSKFYAHALRQYESRRKDRVRRIQNHSRLIGKFMLTDSAPLSRMRNYIMKASPNNWIFKYWDSILSETI